MGRYHQPLRRSLGCLAQAAVQRHWRADEPSGSRPHRCDPTTFPQFGQVSWRQFLAGLPS